MTIGEKIDEEVAIELEKRIPEELEKRIPEELNKKLSLELETTAIELLKSGVEVGIISHATKLSVERIKELKNNI